LKIKFLYAIKIPERLKLIGKTISHYKILEKLGEGGMGVVYKAEDTKLKRTVALKFLPGELTQNKEAKERFFQEAQAAAGLDHPNICNVYEINETEAGQIYIAMAYYDGSTIKEEVEKSPLKLGDAIQIAIQAAHGLQEAKKKGIIHRDIKSANIILNKAGQVKIMDFGLAKLKGRSRLTKIGSTLGTTAYMSPEQARGDQVDHRSDIFSLGVVLYEMISGKLPFRGDYDQAIIYSILNEAPEPLTAVRTGIPMVLENIVNKMLAKDPVNRYQNIEEVPVDLKAVDISSGEISLAIEQTGLISDTHKQEVSGKKWGWKLVLPLVMIAIILSSIMTLMLQKSNPDIPQNVRRFIISPELTKNMIMTSHIALSPDGKSLVYRAVDGSTGSLFLKRMDRFEVTPIAGSEDAYRPFFSPDSRWIAFMAKGKLKKKLLTGGHPFTICDVDTTIHGGTWKPDEKIVLGSFRKGLVEVSASGGELVPLTIPEGITSHRWPQMLPDGKTVLFTVWPSQGHGFDYMKSANIALYSPKTEKIDILLQEGSSAHYLTSGYIIYARTPGDLMAVSFDVKRKKITSIPIPLLEGLNIFASGYAGFGVSEQESLVFRPVPKSSKSTLVWMNRSGKEESFGEQVEGFNPRFSPDGRSVIFSDQDENYWHTNLRNGQKIRLTFDSTIDFLIFHPEGNRVTYSSSKIGYFLSIIEKKIDGSLTEKELLSKNHPVFPISWSADGKHLAYYEFNPETGRDIGVLSIADNTDSTVVSTKAEETSPRFSPDGKWLAFVSNKTGRYEVYVQSFPSDNDIYQITSHGGLEPVWSPDNRELYYSSKGKMMVVAIQTHPVFKRGIPRILFEGNYNVGIYRPGYDIHPDGNRFLMVKYEVDEAEKVNHLRIILNVSEELKHLFSETR
jgi:serine/threonine protein kinase